MGTNEIVEIDVEVLAVSDLAIQVTDGDVECWIPKSALRRQADGCLGDDDALPGKSGTIAISQKLAEEKGLA